MIEYNHPPMRNKTDGVWMARADYDALRKDAERYRFLREGNPGTYNIIMRNAGTALDAAIDEAMIP